MQADLLVLCLPINLSPLRQAMVVTAPPRMHFRVVIGNQMMCLVCKDL